MTQTVLILGATGRFGRNAAQAFHAAGWTVRKFDRQRQDLAEQARGADVIVNGWNPAYPDWARLVPGLHQQVRAVAKVTGATVIIPGNVYVFGSDTPAPWGPNTPHRATNPLGRVRIEMEAAYKREGIRTIVLRAGDFIDTEASGNWFDQIMIKSLSAGKFTYPGRTDIAHAWAFLPDICRAAVHLAEMRHALPDFADIAFPGYTLSGAEMAAALGQVTGRPVKLKQMSWLPLQLARPFWRLGACLVEMKYLWNTPHWLDGARFDQLLPEFRPTDLNAALTQAVPMSVVAREPGRSGEELHPISDGPA